MSTVAKLYDQDFYAWAMKNAELIPPLLGDLLRVTMCTPYALRPAQFAHRLVTVGIINQILDIQHRGLGSRHSKGAVAYPILQL